MLRSILALLLLCGVASAQSAKVVTDCTLGAPYDAGTDRPLIQNQSGQLCIEAGAGSGAPTDAPYYVTTANAGLSAEVVPSANVQAVLDDATFADIRTTLGLGTAALVNTGTSGATIPLLNAAATWTTTQTFNGTNNSVSIAAAQTGSSSSGPAVNITQTLTGSSSNPGASVTSSWNTSGNPAAFKANVTNTASGAGSKLIDLQVGSDSKVDCNANTPFACTFEGSITTPNLVGTITNDNAATGSVGEYISGTLASGSAISLTTNAAVDVISISLPAGDWDVFSKSLFICAATTSVTNLRGSISATSVTLDTSTDRHTSVDSAAYVPNGSVPIPVNGARFSLASTTTIFLVSRATFTVSTATVYGMLWARRVR